jgi:hypothetical protein
MAVRDGFQEWQCLGRSAAGRLFGHGSAYDATVRDGFQAWQCLERSREKPFSGVAVPRTQPWETFFRRGSA